MGGHGAGAAADVQHRAERTHDLGETRRALPETTAGAERPPDVEVDVRVGHAVVRRADCLEVGRLLHARDP